MIARSAGMAAFTLCLLGLPTTMASAQIRLGDKEQQLLSVEIDAHDFDKMRQFYLEVVGLKELPGSDVNGHPDRTSMLSFSGNLADSFVSLRSGAKSPQPDDNAYKTTFKFKVTHIDAVVARARAAGSPVLSLPATAHGMPGLIVATVSDPDGNVVELVEIGPNPRPDPAR